MLAAPKAAHAKRKKGALPTMRRVAGVNDFLYDTEKRTLRIRVSMARFAASKRVSGASVGGPTQADLSLSVPLKYSLLEGKWIPRSSPAPTAAELLARFPGPSWAHFHHN